MLHSIDMPVFHVLLTSLSGSIITAEDLQKYKPQWKTPLRVNLTNPNVTLHLMPPPGGGLILGHILSILDGKYLMLHGGCVHSGLILSSWMAYLPHFGPLGTFLLHSMTSFNTARQVLTVAFKTEELSVRNMVGLLFSLDIMTLNLT